MADPVTLGVAGAYGLNAMGAGTILTAGGNLFSGFMKADAAEEAGRFQQAANEHDAQQLQMAAAESRAAAQRQMFERQRTTKLALSTLQARAGAGGDSATSGDALKLTTDIAGRGEYQSLADLYVGENKARGLEDQAAAKRYEGEVARYSGDKAAGGLRLGSVIGAGGTILSGTGAMAKDYAKIKGGGDDPLSLDARRYGGRYG